MIPDILTNCTIKPVWATGVADKPMTWFYEPVFMCGELNGLQGPPGAGKSWVVGEIAAQTSIGGMVQGIDGDDARTKLPCGNVLYLSGDDSPERLKERLMSRGANLNNIAFAPEDSLPLIGSPEMEKLFELTEPKLCIIDTLQYFIGNVSANSFVAMTAALKPLQVLARRYNTAVVVITHISKTAAKGGGGESTAFSLGSYAIAGIYRTLWTLGRVKDEYGEPTSIRALCQSKNNYAEFDPPAILFELYKGFRWVGIGEGITANDLFNKGKKSKGRPAEKRNDVKETILSLLDGGKPMLSVELKEIVCKITGCHTNTFDNARKELGVQSYQSERKWFCKLETSQNTINTQ